MSFLWVIHQTKTKIKNKPWMKNILPGVGWLNKVLNSTLASIFIIQIYTFLRSNYARNQYYGSTIHTKKASKLNSIHNICIWIGHVVTIIKPTQTLWKRTKQPWKTLESDDCIIWIIWIGDLNCLSLSWNCLLKHTF